MLQIIWRGMAIGVTEIVPGISGSTVAMVLGIYEKLIYSLSLLTSKRWKEAIPFLFMLGIGMVVGFGLALFVISYLLDTYRTPTMMFFAGLIVGFLPFLWQEAKTNSKTKFQLKHYVVMILFISIVVSGQVLVGGNIIDTANLTLADYLFLLASGILASSALVLPGISGALVLTILGVYEIATDALTTLHLPIILAVGSGVVLGVLLTSKLVRYLLENYAGVTYAAMIGLVAGSIFAVVNNLEEAVTSGAFIMSCLTFLAGVVFVYLLQKKKAAHS